MTKNNAMRLGSVMLVLALLSTCALWGTFAKYTTSAETGEQTARVAYWGFDQTGTQTVELFKTAYDSDDSATVKSSGTDKVVAPGTENSADLKFKYTSNSAESISAPDVSYKFTVTAETTDDNSTTTLDANDNFKWTLKCPGDDSAAEYATLEALNTALQTKYGTEAIAAGSLPTDFTAGSDNTFTIGWKWAFGTKDDTSTADTDESAVQDAKDTALGNASTLDNIAVKFTVKAEQVD
jgi:hypothetical protein